MAKGRTPSSTGDDRSALPTKPAIDAPSPAGSPVALASPSAETSTTRAQLSADVNNKFNICIDGLWIWLQKDGSLPVNLPEDWDPIHGDGGVSSHAKRTGHRLSPIPVAVDRIAGDGPNDSLATTRPLPREEACRVCGINYVINRCWLATRDREVTHIESYLGVVSDILNRLKNAKTKLRAATAEFVREHRLRMGDQLRAQNALLERLERRQRAKAKKMLHDRHGTLVRDALAPAETLCSEDKIDRPLERITNGLVRLQTYLAGMARNDAGQSRRIAGSGNQIELATEFVKTLYDHGFEYPEIERDLIPLAMSQSRMGTRGRDRIRKLGSPKKRPAPPGRAIAPPSRSKR